MRVWRICKAQYVSSAFSGEGGLKAPARWHHAGRRIVYTAQSLSLATLEIWVHVGVSDYPLNAYVSAFATIPDDLPVHYIERDHLPSDWNRPKLHPALQDLGTAWLAASETAVARVPAATTPGEFNYLLNPAHADFPKIIPGQVEPFVFDSRMQK